jgi:putative NADPH-quinone reductase
MNELPLVILGSARRHSDTERFVQEALAGMEFKTCDLLDFEIALYNYDHHYPETDGFLQLIDTVLKHPVIIFATPVYWYAMSGSMKIFFDRLTDLVTVKKELGRKLKGKQVFLMAVGADPELPEGFLIPFRLTSAYLGMKFRTGIYHSIKDPSHAAINSLAKPFRDEITAALHR